MTQVLARRCMAALTIGLITGAAAVDDQSQSEQRAVNMAPITIVGEQSSAVLSETG